MAKAGFVKHTHIHPTPRHSRSNGPPPDVTRSAAQPFIQHNADPPPPPIDGYPSAVAVLSVAWPPAFSLRTLPCDSWMGGRGSDWMFTVFSATLCNARRCFCLPMTVQMQWRRGQRCRRLCLWNAVAFSTSCRWSCHHCFSNWLA